MAEKAIIDTSIIRCLFHLGLLSYLQLFYEEIRVPVAVENEFLNSATTENERTNRFQFLDKFYNINSSWFLKCNEYNEELVQIYLSPKIDRGEAEAFAQNQFYQMRYQILLDDKRARILARNKNIVVHGTLFILASLDLRFKICNYFNSVKKLRNELNYHVNDEIIKKVYFDLVHQ